MARQASRRARDRWHGRFGRSNLHQAGRAGIHGRHHVFAGQYQGGRMAGGDEGSRARRSRPMPCDVADFESAAACVKKVAEEVGPVDVLVNNAGITRDMTFKKMDKANWDAVMKTNLDSCFNMTKQVCDGMAERGWGRIINISSVNGQKGAFGQTNYSAAKAGMHGFTKALALEYARKGVTSNTISPGYIGTKMVMAIPKEVLDTQDHSADPDGPPGQARGSRGPRRVSVERRSGVPDRRQHRDQRRPAHVLMIVGGAAAVARGQRFAKMRIPRRPAAQGVAFASKHRGSGNDRREGLRPACIAAARARLAVRASARGAATDVGAGKRNPVGLPRPITRRIARAFPPAARRRCMPATKRREDFAGVSAGVASRKRSAARQGAASSRPPTPAAVVAASGVRRTLAARRHRRRTAPRRSISRK